MHIGKSHLVVVETNKQSLNCMIRRDTECGAQGGHSGPSSPLKTALKQAFKKVIFLQVAEYVPPCVFKYSKLFIMNLYYFQSQKRFFFNNCVHTRILCCVGDQTETLGKSKSVLPVYHTLS